MENKESKNIRKCFIQYINKYNSKTMDKIENISGIANIETKSIQRNKKINKNKDIKSIVDQTIKKNKSKLYKTIQMKQMHINKSKYYFGYSIKPKKRRAKSTMYIPHSYYEQLNIEILLNKKDKKKLIKNKNDKKDKKNKEDISKRLQSSDNCNSYYFCGSLPIKNKYIVDNLFQSNFITSCQSKKQNMAETYRKINRIAKNLHLFNNNYRFSVDQSSSPLGIKSCFSDKLLKVNNKYICSNINSNFFNKTNLEQYCSSFREIMKNKDIENTIIKKIHHRKYEAFSDDKKNQTNDKSADYLYKKIFNKYEKKVKKFDFDNKLNLIYSENEAQYKQKLNKLDNKMYKKGKPIKHIILDEKYKMMTAKLKKKVIFMKKVVDYLYPNMILANLKENNKMRSKNQNITYRQPLSKILSLEKKKRQKALELYLGKAFYLIK